MCVSVLFVCVCFVMRGFVFVVSLSFTISPLMEVVIPHFPVEVGIPQRFLLSFKFTGAFKCSVCMLSPVCVFICSRKCVCVCFFCIFVSTWGFVYILCSPAVLFITLPLSR